MDEFQIVCVVYGPYICSHSAVVQMKPSSSSEASECDLVETWT